MRLFSCVVLAIFAGCGGSSSSPVQPSAPIAPATPELEETTDDQFVVGQRWTFRTPPGSEGSRVVILRIEKTDRTIIVHVAITDVSGPCGPAPIQVRHMPFLHEALAGSVLTVESQGDVPEYASGYTAWRQAFDQGKAGAFSISVAEAVTEACKGPYGG